MKHLLLAIILVLLCVCWYVLQKFARTWGQALLVAAFCGLAITFVGYIILVR